MRVPVASDDVWFKAWVPSQALSPVSRVSLALSGCPLPGPRETEGRGPRDDPQGRRPGSGPKVSLVPFAAMSEAVEGGRAHRTWPQRLLITFSSLCAIVALLVAGALGWANLKTGSVQRVSLGRSLTAEPTSSDAPQNYLLVGTDSAAGLSPNDPAVRGRGDVTGARSDTMMILRIIPKTSKAMLLAIPRDLWVPIYDPAGNQHGSQKLNSAIEYGGADALIRTIDQNFHIPIHHYLQVNFTGFKNVVDAIGGVPIYFSNPVRDRDCNEFDANGQCINHTGLNVPTTGCITLDPTQSLGYVRARYFEYQRPDGVWEPDPSSDLGRASRQQLFIQQALKKAVSKGIRNPITLNNLVDAMLKSITVDEVLSPGAILDLGRKFQSFDPDTLEKIAVPVTEGYAGDAAIEQLVPDQSEAVFARFRDPVADGGASPQGVSVQVLNGSGAYNQATDVTAALAAKGFNGLSPRDSGSPGPQTVIRYPLGKEAAARLVARYLDADVTFAPTALDPGVDVQIVTGSGFRSVLPTPKAEAQVPGPTTTTTVPSGGTTPGTTNPVPPAAAPTTLPGYTPATPPGVKCG